ncbi:MAG: ATP-binding cassette domain-containing protein [Rhodobacter sp.]|nr:ATP-binding cassette domain-containing protein [Rhodobacter sp.]
MEKIKSNARSALGQATTIFVTLLGLLIMTFVIGRIMPVDPVAAMVGERCRTVQMVFQDPYGSLHPRHSVATVLSEPLRIHGLDRPQERTQQALIDVGLAVEFLERFPHQLSGGQRRRVAIARALILEPEVLLLDEPTSALDVSVQAEILNLLARLRMEKGFTYLMVSHDLSVVDHMCDRFAVMKAGRIVEVLPRTAIPSNGATHPYARELIGASLEYERAL